MKNYGGKHERQGHAHPGRSRAGRLAALVTALVLCVLAAVGGTIAYLEERSAAVTNTFTVGDITYTLKLRANAAFVGREDGEVTMPSELAPARTAALPSTSRLTASRCSPAIPSTAGMRTRTASRSIPSFPATP
ncbi:MAG: hypothetical protein Q4E20_07165 [Eubacteriales bacterium]|nr:hypothetical protein [Eubacteriales bacterium]